MSILLLQNPGKRHSLLDDIESCYWLLLYMSLHYFKNSATRFNLAMFDEFAEDEDEDGVTHHIGGTRKDSFINSGLIENIEFACKPLQTVLRDFGFILNRFHSNRVGAGRGEQAQTKQYEDARRELEDGTILQIFEKALNSTDWPKDDILPDRFPPKTNNENKKTVHKNRQGTHQYRTTPRDNGQPSLPSDPNVTSISPQSSTRPNTRGAGTGSMGPPALPVRRSPPATPDAGPSNVHRMRTRSIGNEPFPTIGGTDRNAGDMRSIDSVRSNSSKRGQPDDEKDPETTEEETDRRTKRSRKTTRAEPVQKVYQTRSRTKSDEREKKKVAGSAVQPEQRATRSKTRSTSRKGSTAQTEQRVTRSKTRSASRK